MISILYINFKGILKVFFIEVLRELSLRVDVPDCCILGPKSPYTGGPSRPKYDSLYGYMDPRVTERTTQRGSRLNKISKKQTEGSEKRGLNVTVQTGLQEHSRAYCREMQSQVHGAYGLGLRVWGLGLGA